MSKAIIEINPTIYARVRRIKPKKSNVKYKFKTLKLKIVNKPKVTVFVNFGKITKLLFIGKFKNVYTWSTYNQKIKICTKNEINKLKIKITRIIFKELLCLKNF